MEGKKKETWMLTCETYDDYASSTFDAHKTDKFFLTLYTLSNNTIWSYNKAIFVTFWIFILF